MDGGLPHTVWKCWGRENTFPQRISMVAMTTRKWERKKQLVLQSCAVRSGTPTRVLCRAVQEICQCLALLLEGDSLLSLEMLDVAEEDPVVITALAGAPMPDRGPSPEGVPLQMAGVEELAHSASPDSPSVPKPEGMVPPQDVALVPSRWPPPSTRFSP